MELFKIGGPNPDTNYLFMGKPLTCVLGRSTNHVKAIMSTAATSQSRL
jgi:hypothetical protein